MLPSPRKDPLVSWRDGLHLTGTSIWCDARRSRDVCFASTASALHTARHGQLIATAETIALLEVAHTISAPLAVPYGHPFTLGRHRLELFASGHALGAASLLVQVDDKRVVYAGAVNPHGSGLGGGADVRACDVLVVSARYAQPRFRFPEAAEVLGELRAFCSEIVGHEGLAVLLLDTAAKALDVAAALGGDFPFDAHRSIYEAAARFRQRPEVPVIRRHGGKQGKGGRVLLWPLRVRDKLAALPERSAVALVSGRAIDERAIASAGASHGFALSSHADFDELRRYIEESGAAEVYLTQAPDDGQPLAQALGKLQVEPIGPPEQMSLF